MVVFTIDNVKIPINCFG